MLTQWRLKQLLNYNPETGVFEHRVTRRGVSRGIAGCLNPKGYIQIKVDGTKYLAHRLAFLYMTGEFPSKLVDHRDLNKSNNRWDNIREATDTQNQANTRPRGAVPLKGVCKDRQWYKAQIEVGGKKTHLGIFSTPEEAHAAYVKAANDNFGAFARTA
jgi:hypothetical protein